MRLYGRSSPAKQLDPLQAAKYEDDAGRYWDLFYKRNTDRFFKDRHYFDKEWPQLTQGSLTILEVGCGAGNSVFPLLELNPQLYVYACDFAPRAVELVQSHPAYTATGRVTAFVADITQHEGPGALRQQLPGPCVDYCSMVFVLSAVAPQKMRQVLRNVASVLRQGTGRVLFRDYAEGDMAQTRLQDSTSGARHIRGNFFARGDGTCCYYFAEDELSSLFASEGFVCEESIIHARTIENRKSGVQMRRRWIQAVFRYDPSQQQQQQQQQQQEQQRQWWFPPPAAHQQEQELGQPPAASPRQDSMQASPASSLQSSHDATSSDRSSCCSIECANHTWMLPKSFVAGHLSSSARCCHSGIDTGCQAGKHCCVCLARALASLSEQGEAQLLGKCVLIAPPWLQLRRTQPQQQQQQQPCSNAAADPAQHHQQQCAAQCEPCSDLGQQQGQGSSTTGQLLVVEELVQGTAAGMVACGSAAGADLVPADAAAEEQQGAAAALLALVAVWLGARRVYVCLPQGREEPLLDAAECSQQEEQQHARQRTVSNSFAAGFNAVLLLNECSVVVERIHQMRWQQGEMRHAQLLQKEVTGYLEADLFGGGLVGRGLIIMAATQQQCSAAADGQASQQLIDSIICAANRVSCPFRLLLASS